jgi:lycopene beta-cyclase
LKYDYIIAGSGCSGLSLLYKIYQTTELQDKSILVIDKDQKNKNDRTWCYWEQKLGPFESIVHSKWNKLEFITDSFQKKQALESYTYKMIRGIDFYNFVLSYIKKFKKVNFIFEEIIEINSYKDCCFIKTNKNTYEGKYVFNSTPIFNPKINKQNSLLQHFNGWVIETKKKSFDSKIGRLMDFNITQEDGATFMYVLPISDKEALVEYTLFSPDVLKKEKYTIALTRYIKEVLEIDDYTIKHKESGIIPMSLAKFKGNPKKNIFNIGTAGGYTKASTGYTFQFIQKNISKIVDKLKVDKYPKIPITFGEKVNQWFDKTLLDVLINRKMSGKDVFSKLFKNNKLETILAFLSNESNFSMKLSIMKSLPIIPFFISGIKQLK